jgi:CRP/FNR family transcriptional regulator
MNFTNQDALLGGARRIAGVPACFTCAARTSDLCAAVPDKDIEDLLENSIRIHLKPGESLVMDGDPADAVFNVTAGTMMLNRIGQDGRRQILSFVFPKDFIGFSSDLTYRFNAEAVSEATVCRFDRNRLEHLFKKHPGMEGRFRTMAAKIIEASLDLIFTLGRRGALERVAAFLLYLKSRQHIGEVRGAVIHLPMTRTDIADFLGLTIETVSRAFSKLKRDRVISLITLHDLEVIDLKRLRTISGNEDAGDPFTCGARQMMGAAAAR